MDGVVHFELPADDLGRMKEFYKDTFGWQVTDMPEMNYVIAGTTEIDQTTHMPKNPGAINGGMLARSAMVTVPTFSINVKSVDEAMEKVKAAGGAIIKEKVAVGTIGFIAYFKDTEGNVLSLWETVRM